MRTLMLTVSALTLSCSFAFAQTPPEPPLPDGAPTAEEPGAPSPPPGDEQPGDDLPQSELDAGGQEHGASTMEQRDGPRQGMRSGGPRHEMRGHGSRGGPHWRGMRGMGPEFKVEIDEDGGVKVEVKCGAREEARACADITTELLDRALGN